MRGYSPGAIPAKPAYHAASLGMDVLSLISALGYRSAAVVGHDWGALAGSTAALADPSRIDRLVTLAVPYGTFGKSLLSNGDQQRRSWFPDGGSRGAVTARAPKTRASLDRSRTSRSRTLRPQR
jgi:pimeloyl-ACP methyl ester carboxylesterase